MPTVSEPSKSEPSRPVVHVVEDDADARQATARLLQAAGYAVQTYESAAAFLERLHLTGAGCLVLDVQLPGTSGLELQEMLTKAADVLPVVFVTGHGDIPMSVRAIKAGAVDFLAKPVPGAVLLSAVEQALARNAEERAVRNRVRAVQARYERLTPREREVFAHLIGGQLNKQVAFDLGTKERTIKAHRHAVMQKLEAGSIADLVRIAAELRIDPVRS